MQCTGTNSKTGRGRNVFPLPSKVVTAFILPKKRENYRTSNEQESLSPQISSELLNWVT